MVWVAFFVVLFFIDFLVNSAQADLSVKDKDLNTPLHLACSKVCEEIWNTVIQYNNNSNGGDDGVDKYHLILP